MNVDILLPAAREKLRAISDRAPLIEAAGLLKSGFDLVAVCGNEQNLVGVVSKTDVVERISQCQGASCTCAVATVMTLQVLTCTRFDTLSGLWEQMKSRRIKNVPVLDEARRPLGIITARDVLQSLLTEAKSEESMLRDYVMGFGYR